MNDQLGHTYVQCGPVDTYMSNELECPTLTLRHYLVNLHKIFLNFLFGLLNFIIKSASQVCVLHPTSELFYMKPVTAYINDKLSKTPGNNSSNENECGQHRKIIRIWLRPVEETNFLNSSKSERKWWWLWHHWGTLILLSELWQNIQVEKWFYHTQHRPWFKF